MDEVADIMGNLEDLANMLDFCIPAALRITSYIKDAEPPSLVTYS
jgi:hypothetical protein